ncbi:MAG TPA: carboxypeptidase regulatory-like domain-containing protein [Gemmatimonadales bacterium]|nr:carboxypeptidase regulatory-like domain-containing protein [Gemmatimonadales bacterium]
MRGRVTDQLGHPLEAARVYLEQRPRDAVLTGSNGGFMLRSSGAGRTLIFVHRIGYNAQVVRIEVDSAKGWNGTIVLEPGAFVLPEIRVAARYAKPERYAGTTRYDDVFRRMRLGGGTLISREDIERWQPSRTVEVLRIVPGTKVSIQPPGHPQGTAVAFVRCNEFPPRINVMSIIGEILDRISPNEIEMIEVFRGIGSLPPEFAGDACAAIAIWTRHGGPATDTSGRDQTRAASRPPGV